MFTFLTSHLFKFWSKIPYIPKRYPNIDSDKISLEDLIRIYFLSNNNKKNSQQRDIKNIFKGNHTTDFMAQWVNNYSIDVLDMNGF